MWFYAVSTGMLTHDREFEGTGYSGRGHGRNAPSWDHIRDIGPIPQGRYRIGKDAPHPHLVSPVLPLAPEPGTETYGRSGFLIHGDNRRDDASHGCIILGPMLRHLIANSGDHELTVEA